jgi:anti-anti-sigma factor
MEIVTTWHKGESAEVKVHGRLDGYWADHLAAELARLTQGGLHRLWLDFSEVTYLSSLGIGVLLRLQKQLKSLGGSLKVCRPSQPVLEILDTARLVPILVSEPPGRPGHRITTWEQRAPRRGMLQVRERMSWEVFEYGAGPLRCRIVGDPSLLHGCRFREADCCALALDAEALAVGVGALGREYTDCQGRFGELLAAAGVAAYLPTDGSNVPDYLLLGESPAANVRLCYGIVCTGRFSHLARFETTKATGYVPLTELVNAGIELAGADAVGMVLVAESAGLMGAALQQSPALRAADDMPFAYPEVRDWLTFTGERAYRSSTTLVVGVATRGDAGALAPLVRSVGRGAQPMGHFHAAPFSPRVLPIGEIDLPATVQTLFEEQQLQGLLHLLSDFREPAGLGESEFVRGACWVAPLGPVEVERASP